MQILVVDDEQPVAEVIELVLTSAGHRVKTVADGQTALAEIGHAAYDLVITDLDMSGMDGFTLAEKIKSLRPAQKILVFTGAGDSGPTPVHVDRVLKKPVTARTL